MFLFELAHLMLYACKKSGWVTEQNFEIKPNVLCHFFTSGTLHARLLLEISIHTADVCILAMSCLGYACARLKTLSSLLADLFVSSQIGLLSTFLQVISFLQVKLASQKDYCKSYKPAFVEKFDRL